MKKQYGWMFVIAGLIVILTMSGCGSTSNNLQIQNTSSTADSNTRLLYEFSTAPSVFTSDSRTIALYHLDEVAGSSVSDSSTNANHGLVINGATFLAGKFGNAINLNGTTQFVNVTSNVSMALTNKLTLQAWIKPNTIAAGTRTVVSKFGAATNLGFSLRVVAAVPQLVLSSNGTNSFTFISTASLVANQWAHLAAVVDGNFASIYVNGVLAGKFVYNAPVYNSTAALRIGADNATTPGTNFFSGIIDEIQVKNEALTLPPLVSSVIDSSANNIYGQMVGKIEGSVSPVNGNYLSISGTSQFALATSTALNIQGAWSAETYVRTTSATSPQNILIKGSVAGNNVNYGIQISSTAPANRIRVFFNDDFANLYEIYSVTQLATNTWYHVAGTWDGSVLRVYINGVLEASVNYGSGITPALNANGLNIGRDNAGASYFFGHLDRVRISDIARSSFLN